MLPMGMMNASNGDIDRLVLLHAAHVAAESDLGRSGDHHPMFRPVEVLLRRELAARLYDDALHSVTRSDVYVLIVAPRAIDAAVLDRRAMVVGLELPDQRLHPLGLRAR